jgi:hypothetical protein
MVSNVAGVTLAGAILKRDPAAISDPLSGDAGISSAVAALAKIDDPAIRAQSALELIQRHVGIDSGFLFLTRGQDLELVAPCAGRESPDGLQAMLSTFMVDMMRVVDRTATLNSRLSRGVETATLTCGRREFIPLPLGVTIEDRCSLIGMIALPVERTTADRAAVAAARSGRADVLRIR